MDNEELKTVDNQGLKQCKKCKEQINKKAKKCPRCGANQGMSAWALLIIIVVAIVVIVNLLGKSDISEGISNAIESQTQQEEQQPIEYISVTVDDLENALENNAAVAKDTYNNKYVQVSGKLGVIDSDLKYISLLSSTDEWDIIGIHCTIKTNEQKEVIKTLSKDQQITIKGKITDVGEVLGYYLDITEVLAN